MKKFALRIMLIGLALGLSPNFSNAQSPSSSPEARTLYEMEQALYGLSQARDWDIYADKLVSTCNLVKSAELSTNRPAWLQEIVVNYCDYSNEFNKKFKLKKSGDSHKYCKPLKAMNEELKAAFQIHYREYRERIDYAQLRAERSLEYKNYINSDKQGWYGWKTYNFDCSGK